VIIILASSISPFSDIHIRFSGLDVIRVTLYSKDLGPMIHVRELQVLEGSAYITSKWWTAGLLKRDIGLRGLGVHSPHGSLEGHSVDNSSLLKYSIASYSEDSSSFSSSFVLVAHARSWRGPSAC
jgi:hypothetical protein